MKLYYAGLIIFIYLFVQAAYASHQNDVEVQAPSTIVTTVGKLTTLQVDIRHKGASIEFYQVKITAVPPNKIEITNPSITTKSLKPGETVSIFSNIRTLTESPTVLTIQIFRDNDLSHSVPLSMSVISKKFSLPEFGLIGFLQIISIAAIIYFLFESKTSRQ